MDEGDEIGMGRWRGATIRDEDLGVALDRGVAWRLTTWRLRDALA